MRALLLLATVLSLSFAHEFSICHNHEDHMQVQAVTFSEDNPSPGSTLQVGFSGTPDEDVLGGLGSVSAIFRLKPTKIFLLNGGLCG